MVEPQPSKLVTRVRFPPPALGSDTRKPALWRVSAFSGCAATQRAPRARGRPKDLGATRRRGLGATRRRGRARRRALRPRTDASSRRSSRLRDADRPRVVAALDTITASVRHQRAAKHGGGLVAGTQPRQRLNTASAARRCSRRAGSMTGATPSYPSGPRAGRRPASRTPPAPRARDRLSACDRVEDVVGAALAIRHERAQDPLLLESDLLKHASHRRVPNIRRGLHTWVVILE